MADAPKALEREVGRGGGRGQRKIQNYLIDKGLQFRYIGFVIALSVLLSGGLGYLVWQQEHRASESIVSTLHSGDFSPELRAQVIESLAQDDSGLVLQMVGVGVGLMLVLILYLILMTHKVAGPLAKVSKYFERMAEGRLGEVYPLRRGDMLVGFFNRFKEAHKAVRARQSADMDALESVIELCRDGAGGDQMTDVLTDAATYLERRRQQLS